MHVGVTVFSPKHGDTHAVRRHCLQPKAWGGGKGCQNEKKCVPIKSREVDGGRRRGSGGDRKWKIAAKRLACRLATWMHL